MIPALVGLFHPEVIDALFYLLIFLGVCFLPTYVIFRVFYDWSNGESFLKTLISVIRPIPTELPVGTDLKKSTFPWMTAFLILINILFYVMLPETVMEYMSFPPHRFVSWLQVGLAFFMNAFLHGDNWHLAGNMLFLWVFGSVLETRTGPGRFLAIYVACIVASTLFMFVLMGINESLFNAHGFSSIGASGAIAGIMGVFAVRCYFANVTVGLPFLFLPWVSVPVRSQALVLIGLFSAMDMAGSRAMFGETASHINYWAHTGGYLFGFVLAFLLRFHREASEESVGVKAGRLAAAPFEKEKAAAIYNDVLKKEPENVEALQFLLDYHRYNSQKHPYIFGMLLKVLTEKDMKQAVALFEDYYPKYLNMIPGKIALTLGTYFRSILDLQKARDCFDVARNQSGPWQAKAAFMLGQVFEDMGNSDHARKIFQEICIRFPGTAFAREAKKWGSER